MAMQIVAAQGGKPVAVVSNEDKRQFCLDHGAVGVINRSDFDHWGTMPNTDAPEWGAWMKGARGFGKAIWDAVGERKSPRIVFEHPGEAASSSGMTRPPVRSARSSRSFVLALNRRNSSG